MPQKLKPSFKLNEAQLEQLKQIAPEAFKDGMLDFNSLYDALGDYNEEDSIEMDDNFYGLYWPGKRAAKRAASIPPRGTLVPVKGDGVDEENTKNIYIEGDNLEVLKLLQKSYAGKIKMIYIDPPYNTGNDFVYSDDFKVDSDQWLVDSGQVDEQGEKIVAKANSRADGRFHSKWLNMMYPRLKLAHSLLREDGVIFISIDDNEVAQLRKICDEIFGEENFVANIIWQKKYTRSNDARWFSDNHDHILCYAKYNIQFTIKLLPRNDEQLSAYSNPDKHIKGLWKSTPLHAKSGTNTSPYKFSNGIEWKPPIGTYRRFNDESMQEMDKNNEIWFGVNGMQTPSRKSFLCDVKEGVTPVTIWTYDEVGHNHEANNELKELSIEGIFNNPKPTRLLKRLLQLTSEKGSIILDFFSGSATTAHAVMQLNAEDGGSRQYIMVQLPEKCDEKSEAFKAGYKNICEIGKERIRRAGKKIVASGQLPVASEKTAIGETGNWSLTTGNLDIGFKVFRLSSSNYKKWQNYTGTDIKAAEDLFVKYENPLVDNWKEEDLLTEIMLTEGFPLDSTITVIKDFKKNKVTQISSDFCEHSLFICLDKTIHAETIKALTLSQHDIFICLDNAITDQDKVRLDDKGLIKTI